MRVPIIIGVLLLLVAISIVPAAQPQAQMDTQLQSTGFAIAETVRPPTKIDATIRLSDSILNPGDTLYCLAEINDTTWHKKAMTLNVWVEDVNHTSRWQLRYPILGGVAKMVIVFPAGTSDAHYAINCSVQPVFFDLIGNIKVKYKQDSIGFTLFDNNGNFTYGALEVRNGHEFRLGKVLFEQTAYIFFSEYGKQNRKLTDVEVVLPLDSAFASIFDTSCIVKVGNPQDDAITATYRFSTSEFLNPRGTLENVTITANRKTKADSLEEEYVKNGLFAGGNSMFFDGDDHVLRSSIDVVSYLRGRVPGLLFQTDTLGILSVSWRGGPTSFFLDEMRIDMETLLAIPVTDIAMIKVFRPPFFGAFGGGPGGAVAVYTRRGRAIDGSVSGGFVVNGYTPQLYVLPIGD